MGACLSTEKVVGGHAAEQPQPKSEVVAQPSSPKPAASVQVDVTEIDANDLKDMIKISEHAAYTLYTVRITLNNLNLRAHNFNFFYFYSCRLIGTGRRSPIGC
jgi:hypothetical protein